ncbi:MAG: holo-ACP synthase [Nitrospinae bacterium]|nr:holo-ACP synthase [Nitrospinota bacterium]
MIYGAGIDIIEIGRIKKSLERYSGRFEERVFTPGEIAYCRSKADPGMHFAARFAVKEAVLKSLGSGLSGGIAWKDIEVINHPETGRPFLRLSGKGKDLFDALKLKGIHISISHDKTYAIAQAIAES